eukprot:TRINITY_DN1159_c0_g1_i1.p1 TRINITY_DN1159_c0_g1~~TRINITY_DN1159_c0_g1_i1.p1  ORF type:complete len:252 (+),score=58.94 TRINITY_DN1159_c0_g1_i1:52-756(+)
MGYQMKKALASLGIVSLGLFGGNYYLLSQVKEKSFPAFTFAYREFQGEYSAAGKACMELGMKTENKFKEKFASKEITGMGYYYDNPRWLARQNDCRSALGFQLNSTLVAQEDVKKFLLEENLSKVEIPAFNSLAVDYPLKSFGMLYKAYMGILIMKYMSKYGKTFSTCGRCHFPIGETYVDGKVGLFIPEPAALSKFDFIKMKEPELNQAGKNYQKHCAEMAAKNQQPPPQTKQ